MLIELEYIQNTKKEMSDNGLPVHVWTIVLLSSVFKVFSHAEDTLRASFEDFEVANYFFKVCPISVLDELCTG